MLPVSPNEPKERTTGATDALDETELSLLNALIRGALASKRNESTRFRLHALSAKLSTVHPGMVIAPAADVLTSAQRQAIGRMRDYAKYEMHYTHADDPASQLDIDMAVIDAIADGGAK